MDQQIPYNKLSFHLCRTAIVGRFGEHLTGVLTCALERDDPGLQEGVMETAEALLSAGWEGSGIYMVPSVLGCAAVQQPIIQYLQGSPATYPG